jgi:site-specific DNA-cytosine methylase
MNVLELFAGSRSVGKVAERMGMNVKSSDINNFDNISYVKNILDFDYNELNYKPDIIWASPPCTAFSVAAMGYHWGGDTRLIFLKHKLL